MCSQIRVFFCLIAVCSVFPGCDVSEDVVATRYLESIVNEAIQQSRGIASAALSSDTAGVAAHLVTESDAAVYMSRRAVTGYRAIIDGRVESRSVELAPCSARVILSLLGVKEPNHVLVGLQHNGTAWRVSEFGIIEID